MTTVKTVGKTDPKILRILRLRVTDKPGYLGKIATLLEDLQANIGEIHIHSQGPDFIIRDISLQLDDESIYSASRMQLQSWMELRLHRLSTLCS